MCVCVYVYVYGYVCVCVCVYARCLYIKWLNGILQVCLCRWVDLKYGEVCVCLYVSVCVCLYLCVCMGSPHTRRLCGSLLQCVYVCGDVISGGCVAV